MELRNHQARNEAYVNNLTVILQRRTQQVNVKIGISVGIIQGKSSIIMAKKTLASMWYWYPLQAHLCMECHFQVKDVAAKVKHSLTS